MPAAAISKPEMKPLGYGLLLAALSITYLAGRAVERQPSPAAPLQVIEAFLKASYAHDYGKAYQSISSRDQRVWDQKSYTRQYGSFTGFALEAAEKLADGMDIWIIEQTTNSNRARLTVGYKVPTAD